MRLATWNVQHGRRPDGKVDLGLVVETCRTLRAGVIGLQEVEVGMARTRRADQVAELGTALGMVAAFAPAQRRTLVGRTGVGILVRGGLRDVEVRALPRAGRVERRVVLLATAVLDEVALTVAVCHLGLKGEGFDQLPAVLAALAERPPPRVLLGDLNLRPPRVQPVVEAAGYRLAGGPDTFPAAEPDRRIDHVAVVGLELGEVSVPQAPVSDHRPLVVEAHPSGR